MSAPTWLEVIEAFVADVIADNDLDPTLAWEDIKDMAQENADAAWDEDN
jgi:hypothetical protein